MAQKRVGVRPRPTPLVPTSLGFNYGYDFDGVDEGINISGSLGLTTDDSFSISYWFKLSSLNHTSDFQFAEVSSTSNSSILLIRYYRKLLMVITADDGTRADAWTNITYNQSDVWYNVVWTKNTGVSSSDLKCYVNGSLVTTVPFYLNNLNSGQNITCDNLFIGGQNIGFASPRYFYGKMDDVQFYNFELNATQVADIYNSGYVKAPTLGPVHHWKLGESDTWDGSNWTVNDSIGSLNGTSFNMEESDRKLGVAYSMDFDGVDEYISFPNYNISGAFSVMAWFKTTATGVETIVADWGSGIRSWQLRLSANKVQAYTSQNGAGFSYFTTPLNYNDGNWHQVIFTFGPTGNGILYMDGSSVAVSSYSFYNVFNSSSNLEIGRNQFETNYFDGNLMYVSIFDSELSASDVTSLYNSGVPVDPRDVSLSPSFFVPLGGENDTYDGTDWTIVDEINGNNGTSVNMEEADKTVETP